MRSPWFAPLLASAMLASALTLATAQTPRDFTRVYGVSDRDVPTPAHSTKTLTDTSALQKIVGFVKMSGVTDWKGLTADGTMIYAGDPVIYPAHLAILGSDRYRLDVDRAKGKESTVLNGELSILLPAQGARSSISSDISSLGLLAFPRLLSPTYPNAKSIVTDQGATTISGKTLLRITLDDPATDPTGTPWKTQDLYFDPQTGRLAESAALVHLSTADSAMYMLITTYDDYRDAGGEILPHSFTQSLNGTAIWTLKLNSISLTSLPSSVLFQF